MGCLALTCIILLVLGLRGILVLLSLISGVLALLPARRRCLLRCSGRRTGQGLRQLKMLFQRGQRLLGEIGYWPRLLTLWNLLMSF